jgi:hypothetical protein
MAMWSMTSMEHDEHVCEEMNEVVGYRDTSAYKNLWPYVEATYLPHSFLLTTNCNSG